MKSTTIDRIILVIHDFLAWLFKPAPAADPDADVNVLDPPESRPASERHIIKIYKVPDHPHAPGVANWRAETDPMRENPAMHCPRPNAFEQAAKSIDPFAEAEVFYIMRPSPTQPE